MVVQLFSTEERLQVPEQMCENESERDGAGYRHHDLLP
jgi:hypothetical protein